jgi:hypothetical protein
MVKINEASAIRRVLEQSNDSIMSESLSPGYAGIVVETVSGDPSFPDRNQHEGTLVYFPGATARQLSVRGDV